MVNRTRSRSRRTPLGKENIKTGTIPISNGVSTKTFREEQNRTKKRQTIVISSSSSSSSSGETSDDDGLESSKYFKNEKDTKVINEKVKEKKSESTNSSRKEVKVKKPVDDKSLRRQHKVELEKSLKVIIRSMYCYGCSSRQQFDSLKYFSNHDCKASQKRKRSTSVECKSDGDMKDVKHPKQEDEVLIEEEIKINKAEEQNNSQEEVTKNSNIKKESKASKEEVLRRHHKIGSKKSPIISIQKLFCYGCPGGKGFETMGSFSSHNCMKKEIPIESDDDSIVVIDSDDGEEEKDRKEKSKRTVPKKRGRPTKASIKSSDEEEEVKSKSKKHSGNLNDASSDEAATTKYSKKSNLKSSNKEKGSSNEKVSEKASRKRCMDSSSSSEEKNRKSKTRKASKNYKDLSSSEDDDDDDDNKRKSKPKSRKAAKKSKDSSSDEDEKRLHKKSKQTSSKLDSSSEDEQKKSKSKSTAKRGRPKMHKEESSEDEVKAVPKSKRTATANTKRGMKSSKSKSAKDIQFNPSLSSGDSDSSEDSSDTSDSDYTENDSSDASMSSSNRKRSGRKGTQKISKPIPVLVPLKHTKVRDVAPQYALSSTINAEQSNAEGNKMFSRSQYSAAYRLFTKAIELNPDIKYYENRAKTLYALKMFKNAVADCHVILANNPQSLNGRIQLIRTTLALGDTEACQAAFDEHDNMRSHLSVDLIEQMRKQLALLMELKIEIETSRVLEDHKKTLELTLRASQIAEGSINFRIWKVDALIKLNRLREAQDECSRILQLENMLAMDAFALCTVAYCFYLADKLELCLEYYKQALKIEPQNRIATSYYQKLTQIRNLRTQAFQAKDSLPYFLQCLELVRNVDGRGNSLMESKLYYNCAMVTARDRAQSFDYISKAISLCPLFSKAILYRAKLYMNEQKYREALEDYQTVFRIDPKTPGLKSLLDSCKANLMRTPVVQKDYYKILGIEKGATDEEIKKAYKRKAMIHHPDRHSNASEADRKEQESVFKVVGDAYAILSDTMKRRMYDIGFQTVGR